MQRTPARHTRVVAALTMTTLLLSVFAPAVAASDGLEVTTPYPGVAVAPGTKVSFDLTVSSTRAADVAMSITGVPTNWTASLLGGGFVVDGVAVTPTANGTLRLDVSVPADAAAGTSTLRVNARGGGAVDTLPITIRVDAEAAGEVSLTTATPALTGSSDATFTFDLQYKNDTAQDVTVSVAATGPTGWEVKAALAGETQAASTVVKAGATQAITVTATPAAQTAAGSYPIKVEAQAGDRSVSADLSIDVTGSYSLTLSTPGDLLSARGSAGTATTQAFQITNNGTAPLTTAEITATPPNGWEVSFDPSSIASINPTETATINATITPSADAVAGDYVVTFDAKAAEPGATGTAQIRFTVETSPIWALIGIGVIILILGGLFWVFRTYGRR